MKWYSEFLPCIANFMVSKDSGVVFSKQAKEDVLLTPTNIQWRDEYAWPLLVYTRECQDDPNKQVPWSKEIQEELKAYVLANFNMMEQTKRAMSEVVKLNTEDIPEHNNRDRICLIVSYYYEIDDERRAELEECMASNIHNELIDEVVVFAELKGAVNEDAAYDLFSFIPDVRQIEGLKLIPTDKRITYADALNYAKDAGCNNTVYILSNIDCYYDDTIDLLRKVNFNDGRRILNFTRKDRLSDGSIRDAVRLHHKPHHLKTRLVKYNKGNPTDPEVYEQCGIMPPWSSDAWAFTVGAAYHYANKTLDIQLGRLACEQEFQSRLFRDGFDVLNVGIGGHVRCIHVHMSALRYTENIKASEVNDDLSWELTLPYTESKEWVRPTNVEPHSYITGTDAGWHHTNYYCDDRTSGNYGEYFVRDIKPLLSFET